MSAEKKRAREDEKISLGKGKILLYTEKIRSCKSERNGYPKSCRSSFFKDYEINNGNEKHIHCGDKARLACGCVDYSHLLSYA